MMKQQLIDKIMGSSNFQWKNYANQYHLTGRDYNETCDNIELHLHTQDQDFLNMMYEACCMEEVDMWNAEASGYIDREMTSDEFNSMMYQN